MTVSDPVISVATNSLRILRRKCWVPEANPVFGRVAAQTLTTYDTLQRAWQRSDGVITWEDVPVVEEE